MCLSSLACTACAIATSANYKPQQTVPNTLMHSMPSFSNVLWMGSSRVSTTTLLVSSMSTFMESHLEDIQRGWLSGITG